MFKRSKWIKGTATLVEYQVLSTGASEAGFLRSNVRVSAVAQADGIEPTAAQFMLNVQDQRLPFPAGYVFDVKIDASEPSRVRPDEDPRKIKDEIAAKRDQVASQQLGAAEQLAQRMRDGSSED